MIVDAHTHAFPPAVIERREEIARREPGFAALYAEPAAVMATADDLLASMDRAGVDAAVVLNFAWPDPDICSATNEYLASAAARSGGRLVAFGMLPLASPAAALRELDRVRGGLAGLGELRPDDQGVRLADDETSALLGEAARAGLALLFHVTEPAGHRYPGKQGLAPDDLVGFAARHRGARIIAAHWGGGLPFYTLMPEVRDALATTWFDTSATSLLYAPSVFRVVAGLVGPERILFGSDFPLLSQRRQSENAAKALPPAESRLVLGENARRLFWPAEAGVSEATEAGAGARP